MKRNSRKISCKIFTLQINSLVCAALAVFLLLVPAMAFGEKVTLAWDANSESDLKGYTLYYGTVSGNYTSDIDVGNKTQYTTPELQDGVTYYFAVTAKNNDDLESDYSAELPYTVGSPNPDPTYSITVTAGANGSISPSGTVTVDHGSRKSFSISANQDYQVSAVWVDGSSMGAISSYTFENVTQNHTISASFKVTKEVVVDSDADGVPDDEDAFPFDADEYLDTDGDGEGNNADTDDDNDGMPDEWELAYGLNPLADDAGDDPDGDEISNIDEFDSGTAPNHYEGNFKPETPILLSPENGATVGLTPQFETGDFDDPNINDDHGKTQWVVMRAFDGVSVFDVTSKASLTSLTLPKLILEEDTEYLWKTRFIDSHNSPSEWSEEREFISDFTDHDTDKNGVPDVQEIADTLDLDADGTADVIQPDIRCANFQSTDAEVQICISIKDAESVQSIVSLEVEDPADPNLNSATDGKPNYFEFGLLNFKLLVNNPGDETVVTIHLSKAAFKKGNCFKYDPVNEVWMDYSEYTEFSPSRKQVYLTLKDGGFGDADGIKNGIIVDPLAFGSESDPSGGGSDDWLSDDILGGLGCFISTAAAHTDERRSPKPNPWSEIRGREPAIILMVLLMIYLGKIFLSEVRRNRKVL
ncbi:MAG: fibronectin type III domain-containing protein [bacterium]|nr:fibronectin type III domain-containing protein [bacterium]